MQNYKDLKVWEKAHLFTHAMYEASQLFPGKEIYSLTNQQRIAASSIPANIAEGCGKNTQAEFARFLNIALGSANESEYFLSHSKDLKHLNQIDFDNLSSMINEIKAMLISIITIVREVKLKV